MDNSASMPTSVAHSFAGLYRGKHVLVTGHTGFKGSWLCEWLLALGAEVTGLSLPPPTTPALFDQLGLAPRIHHRLGDVRNLEDVRDAVAKSQPDFIFHLAAQPLVRLSYEQPVETYATNVQGTVHVLEAARLAARPCTVVAITTDKCYENQEWVHSYREVDPLGGYDPYSSSKGAAELVIAAYRRSYFSAPTSPVRLASARAGNVIGGGDWARDRIVPDCIRALQNDAPIIVRNKSATRPWQHVLEPLSGYLWLGARIHQAEVSQDKEATTRLASPLTLARTSPPIGQSPNSSKSSSATGLVGGKIAALPTRPTKRRHSTCRSTKRTTYSDGRPHGPLTKPSPELPPGIAIPSPIRLPKQPNSPSPKFPTTRRPPAAQAPRGSPKPCHLWTNSKTKSSG